MTGCHKDIPRLMALSNTIKHTMKRTVDEETKTVYFQGDWPSVMGIPHIMKKYPGYTHCVLNWKDYEEKYGKKESV